MDIFTTRTKSLSDFRNSFLKQWTLTMKLIQYISQLPSFKSFHLYKPEKGTTAIVWYCSINVQRLQLQYHALPCLTIYMYIYSLSRLSNYILQPFTLSSSILMKQVIAQDLSCCHWSYWTKYLCIRLTYIKHINRDWNVSSIFKILKNSHFKQFIHYDHCEY